MANEQVEKYRLTKDQSAFMKQYGKMKKARDLISSGMLKAKNELQSLSQLAGTINEGMKRMAMGAPEQKTHELEGQEEKR